MARKTIEITKVLHHGNFFLKHSPDEAKAERMATANFMESLLSLADAYAGFGYLETAGIDHNRWTEAWAKHRAVAEIRKANGIIGYNNDQPRWKDYCSDDTRRQYYVHKALRKDLDA